jgi:peptidoglycan hydrolase-like protein with peptidoglycan-binding domain
MCLLKKITVSFAVIIIFVLFQTSISYADYTRVSESVNLREKPSTDSKVLKLVPMGYEIFVINGGESGGGWTRVTFDGITGYVKNEFIENIKGTPPADAVTQAGADASAGSGGGVGSNGNTGGGGSNDSASGGPTGGGSGGSDGSSGSGALSYGNEGDSVRELQRLLTEKGVYQGPVNGKFGPLTEEAVMNFQLGAGLEVDGIVGSETMNKLREKPRAPGTLRNGDEGEGVTSLQKKLKAKGYYSGPVNGKFGPLTEEAVVKFQTANKLEADGIVGKATLELINAPAKEPDKAAGSSGGGSGGSGGSSSSSSSGGNNIGSSGYKSPPIAPNGVEYMYWSDVKGIFKIGLTARVYDVRSGVVYEVRSFSNGNHADVEPITTGDTELVKSTFGGVWSWDPRPVWVTVNGRTIAGSINGMPHGGGVNDENGMDGQLCLHFLGGSTHNSNKTYAQRHQDAIVEAWNAAKNS